MEVHPQRITPPTPPHAPPARPLCGRPDHGVGCGKESLVGHMGYRILHICIEGEREKEKFASSVAVAFAWSGPWGPSSLGLSVPQAHVDYGWTYARQGQINRQYMLGDIFISNILLMFAV